MAFDYSFRCATLVVALAMYASPSRAQFADPPAQRTLIKVLMPDGRPWVGAPVTLVSNPLSDAPFAGDPLIIEATSDERGIASAALPVGREFSAFVLGSQRDDPVSDVANEIVAGDRAKLEQTSERVATTVEFRNLDAWKHRGPFRIAMHLHGPKCPFVSIFEMPESALDLLPPPAGCAWSIALLDKDQVELWRQRLPPDKDRATFEVPPPRRLVIELGENVDRSRSRWVDSQFERSMPFRRCATFDEEGRAEIECAFSVKDDGTIGWPRPQFLARGEGTADTLLSVNDFVHSNENDAVRTVTWKPQSGWQLRGRILDGGKPPLIPLTLALCASVACLGEGTTRFATDPYVTKTDANGCFVIDGRRTGHRLYVLQRNPTNGAWPVAILDHCEAMDADRDLGDIELADLHRVTIAVRHPDGRPSRTSIVLVSEFGRSGQRPYAPLKTRTGRGGEVTLSIREGLVHGFLAASPDGYALGRIEASGPATSSATASVSASTRRIEAKLAVEAFVEGHVVDDRGTKLANARVSTAWINSTNDAVGAMLHRMSGMNAIPFGDTVTDEDGHFRLPLVGIATTSDLYAYVRTDNKSLQNQSPVRVEAVKGGNRDVSIIVR